MRDFSDDQVFARGAYGPRLRHFNGSKTDYKVTETVNASSAEIDQLRYIVECFVRKCRQGVLSSLWVML